MWPRSYFAGTYFAPTYWAQSLGEPAIDTKYSISIGSFSIRPLITVEFSVKPLDPNNSTIEDYE